MNLSLSVFTRVFIVSLLLHSGILQGWGFEAHKIINHEAVKLLPPPLGSSFSRNISYISEHAIDPDLWKNDDPDELSGHYMDADLYGQYPFTSVPRSKERLIDIYGMETVKRWGTAPWRIENYFFKLVEQFRESKWEDAKLTASALGHYVSDIHMPLHVVENYNGQLTGNKGVHGQWENQMVNKYLLSKVSPTGDIFFVKDPVEEAFTIIVKSYLYHTQILTADSLARKDLTEAQRDRITDWEDSLDDINYLEILFKESGELAKKRMESAAICIASFWYSAWVIAGSPEPPRESFKSKASSDK